jgi:FkbM family methyltransferase
MIKAIKRKLGWRALLPVDWLNDTRRLAKAPLSLGLKRRIALGSAKICLYQSTRNNLHPLQCSFAGYRFKAYSLATLAFLYREIFIDLDYYFPCSKQNPYIIDCGSNIGMGVLFFKTLYPQSTVVSFEPAPDSFQLLQQNVELNNLPNVQLNRSAVGRVSGTVEFFQEQQPGAVVASTNSQRVSGRKITVQQVRLSDFIEREVDFLKLDVEGAEDGVMDELIEAKALRRIARMTIEYHHHIDSAKDHFSKFLARLEENGFGYQLKAQPGMGRKDAEFQDFLIYAYRKP